MHQTEEILELNKAYYVHVSKMLGISRSIKDKGYRALTNISEAMAVKKFLILHFHIYLQEKKSARMVELNDIKNLRKIFSRNKELFEDFSRTKFT